jgi:hypothetical protein
LTLSDCYGIIIIGNSLEGLDNKPPGTGCKQPILEVLNRILSSELAGVSSKPAPLI